MNLKSYLNSKVNKMDWLDIALIKWSCIAFGVLIAILIPQITELNIWIVVGLVVILGIRPGYRAYSKK